MRSPAAPARMGRSRPRSAAPPPAEASEEVVERAKQLAAEELEASPEDMVLDLDTGPLPRRRRAGAGAHLGGSGRRG